ncbi:MAG TPA: amidase family protein [Kineosporiaceae bacterium]
MTAFRPTAPGWAVRDSVSLAPTDPTGPLAGASIAVKDLFDVPGRVSSFGCEAWRRSHPPAQRLAPLLADLLGAGAGVAGLAKLDQLAYALSGTVGEGDPPVNPRHPDRITAGSSSGSAAAVAGGEATLGLGTDTVGSIRVPAAACGIFGLRPSHGHLDVDGVLPLAPSLDVPGLLAARAAPLRAALEVVTAATAGGPGHGRDPFRRVLLPVDLIAEVDADTGRAVSAVAEQVAARVGCTVEPVEVLAVCDARAADLLARCQAREVWRTHGPWLQVWLGELADDVRERVERARTLAGSPPGERRSDRVRLRRLRQRCLDLTAGGTLVVMPVTPGPAPRRDAGTSGMGPFRAFAYRAALPASVCGAPQVVAPARCPSGELVGVGLLTAPGEDRGLLDLLTAVWADRPWIDVAPVAQGDDRRAAQPRDDVRSRAAERRRPSATW